MAALKELEPRLAKKILRRELRKGLKPIQAAVKANAPVRSGKLRKAVILRATKRTRKNRIGVKVSLGKGAFFVGDQFYGAFQEFEHKSGKRPHTGSRSKTIPGKH